MAYKPAIRFYKYDDHTSVPFKLVHLQPATDNSKEKPHRHNFFQIFIIQNGGGSHLIDFEEEETRSKSIHLVNPGTVHALYRNENTKGFVLLFSREFFESNVRNASLFLYRNDFKKIFELPADSFQRIVEYIAEMDKEIQNNDAHQNWAIKSILHIIIIEIQRHIDFSEEKNTQDSELLNKYKQLVELHFDEQHAASFYATELSVTTEQLNKVVKATLRKTASDIIQDRILLEAKRLLSYSNLSIKEIAFSLGYEDPSYFNRFFKRKVGQTPLVLKKAMHEKYHD